MSDDIDLDGIERLIDEATEAPFEIDGCDQCGVWGRGGSQFVGDMIASQDARFLVAARNQLPALVAEVRRLRAKVVLADKLAEAAHDLTRWDICRFVEQAPEDERIYFESGVGGVRSAVVRYRKGVT